jgi:hypothetical protein
MKEGNGDRGDLCTTHSHYPEHPVHPCEFRFKVFLPDGGYSEVFADFACQDVVDF